jgi:peptidoglycan/xylan/chitin deacetylase (PgdA/CDA1 family)
MSSIRADRLASLYLFHPLQRFRKPKPRIPILMYHSISDSDDSDRHPYYRTVTAPRVFEQHMKFLHQNGYQTVSVTDLSARLQTANSTERLVGITFDDGYADFCTTAFPILDRYGYSATVFLPTGYIGQSPRQFNGVSCLTWNQVRELRKSGVEFGSHTVTHPQLRDVAVEKMRTEVGLSKRDIEENLGERVDAFSYPYAFPETASAFVGALERVLLESEYRSGVTTIVGQAASSENPLFIKRLPVNSQDDDRLLKAKLEGGYDWLRNLQYLSKILTSAGHAALTGASDSAPRHGIVRKT